MRSTYHRLTSYAILASDAPPRLSTCSRSATPASTPAPPSALLSPRRTSCVHFMRSATPDDRCPKLDLTHFAVALEARHDGRPTRSARRRDDAQLIRPPFSPPPPPPSSPQHLTRAHSRSMPPVRTRPRRPIRAMIHFPIVALLLGAWCPTPARRSLLPALLVPALAPHRL